MIEENSRKVTSKLDGGRSQSSWTGAKKKKKKEKVIIIYV